MTRSSSPYIHAAFISIISLFYAAIFIFTSNHSELNSMLANGTLQSTIWNGWSTFIKAGNMRFFGYLILLLTIAILLTMFIKKQRHYDEYQLSIFIKLLLVAGIISIIMLPLILFMLLSDRNYLVETLFLFALIQNLGLLTTSFFYVVKY